LKFIDVLTPLMNDFWITLKPVKVGITIKNISYCNWWQYKNLSKIMVLFGKWGLIYEF
jgi:hypothetical protein